MDSPLPLRERYRQELVARGLAERTVDAYLRAVVQMVDRPGWQPARMSEADVRAYWASLVGRRTVARNRPPGKGDSMLFVSPPRP